MLEQSVLCILYFQVVAGQKFIITLKLGVTSDAGCKAKSQEGFVSAKVCSDTKNVSKISCRPSAIVCRAGANSDSLKVNSNSLNILCNVMITIH